MLEQNSPLQRIPSPWYPGLHVQLYDPLVLLHIASELQLCFRAAHSSISRSYVRTLSTLSHSLLSHTNHLRFVGNSKYLAFFYVVLQTWINEGESSYISPRTTKLFLFFFCFLLFSFVCLFVCFFFGLMLSILDLKPYDNIGFPLRQQFCYVLTYFPLTTMTHELWFTSKVIKALAKRTRK